MNGAWVMGLVALAGCDAHVSTPEALSPSVEQTAAGASTPFVAGSVDPAECDEAPPPQPEVTKEQAFVDAALPQLDECTQKLTKAGTVAISLLFEATGVPKGVYVTKSTVRECLAIECIRKHLSRLRTSGAELEFPSLLNVDLALQPRARPRRIDGTPSPGDAERQTCTDPEGLPSEIERERLPPEQIQRIIRERYPAIRNCYESGLASNPHLKGKITTRFTIGRDGGVSSAHVEHNELHDCRVAKCIREEMAKCTFPKPKYGIVTVVYPLMFEPR